MADDDSTVLNEKILNECFQLYDGKLVKMAKEFGLEISPPSKRIVVLLLGNHSAGKSSFINWYVGENIQKAGVAVETQGFTFVQHGRRRETLLAEGALLSLPQFQEVSTIDGLQDFLMMEITPSQQRKFRLVTFIDSPGLVDGGLEYPFDVDETLLLLGKLADLIFVFFDPIGQALCKRTLGVVRELSDFRKDGIVFLLSKADQAGNHSDRQKVMVQIVQELCFNAGFNQQGFEIKSIYIPGMAGSTETINQIEEVCGEIEKAVSFTVQRTLNRLGQDCATLMEHIAQETLKHQFQFTYTAMLFLAISMVASAVWMADSLEKSNSPTSVFDFMVQQNPSTSSEGCWSCFTSISAFLLFAFFSNLRGLFLWSDRIRIAFKSRVIRNVLHQKDILYAEYLSQSMPN